MHGVLQIDLSAVQHNFRYLQNIVGPTCVVAPALKADAYGLGMRPIAEVLKSCGAKCYFVALTQEAIELRSIDAEADIFVLHGFNSVYADEYRRGRFIPVLNSREQISSYQVSGGGPCALHFDTGMNRLGISQGEVLEDLSGLDIILVMSHFTSSEDHAFWGNQRQIDSFLEIADKFPSSRKSLANSGGIFLSGDCHFDMVRSGIAIYGGNPVLSEINQMRSVVQLSVPVLQIHAARRGDTAGYNCTYEFEKDSVVAVVSCGYADGMFRSLSNSGALYWNGYRLPIRGRVSMDLAICDITQVPENCRPMIGDMLQVIGHHQSLEQIASDAGTISYEILTSLGRRFHRSYIL